MKGQRWKPSRRRQAFRAERFSTISSRKKRCCWRGKGAGFSMPSGPPCLKNRPARRPVRPDLECAARLFWKPEVAQRRGIRVRKHIPVLKSILNTRLKAFFRGTRLVPLFPQRPKFQQALLHNGLANFIFRLEVVVHVA